MNDYEAMEAIHELLEGYYCGAFDAIAAMGGICRIAGENKIAHNEVKES